MDGWMDIVTLIRLDQCCPTFLYMRAPCSDCNNNNNNNNNNNKVILIKTTTNFIFYDSSHEIIVICNQESAREGELSEDRL
jgi:hypothetical protein